jgi:hypothetical protein
MVFKVPPQLFSREFARIGATLNNCEDYEFADPLDFEKTMELGEEIPAAGTSGISISFGF